MPSSFANIPTLAVIMITVHDSLVFRQVWLLHLQASLPFTSPSFLKEQTFFFFFKHLIWFRKFNHLADWPWEDLTGHYIQKKLRSS